MNYIGIINLCEECKEINSCKWLKKLSKTLYLNKIKKLIVKNTDVLFVYGLQVININLNCSKDQFKLFDQNVKEALFLYIKNLYQIENIYLQTDFSTSDKRTYNTMDKFVNITKYIMFKPLMEMVLETKGITYKDLKLVIIDSGDRKINYILECLYEKLNHLKIITQRQEYFYEFQEMIYTNMGLVLQLESPEKLDDLEEDIIIDLNKDWSVVYKKVKKGSIIIDMEYSCDKKNYYVGRGRGSNILYGIQLKKEFINSELSGLIFAIYEECIYSFLEDRKRNDTLEKFENIRNMYGLQINDVKFVK